jgi:hypothetical protein
VLLHDFNVFYVIIKELKPLKTTLKLPLTVPYMLTFLSVHAFKTWNQLEFSMHPKLLKQLVALGKQDYTLSPQDAIHLCLEYTTCY